MVGQHQVVPGRGGNDFALGRVQAVEQAGYKLGKQIYLGMDVAVQVTSDDAVAAARGRSRIPKGSKRRRNATR